MGFRFGTPKEFKFIEKYYINEVNEDTVLMFRAGIQYDIRKKVFKLYMKLDTGDKIHVDTDKNHEKISSRMNKYTELTKTICSSV